MITSLVFDNISFGNVRHKMTFTEEIEVTVISCDFFANGPVVTQEIRGLACLKIRH